jgi:hypothetical protein
MKRGSISMVFGDDTRVPSSRSPRLAIRERQGPRYLQRNRSTPFANPAVGFWDIAQIFEAAS